MLASTVKFSRCGRYGPARRAPVSGPLEVSCILRPKPQDPTACLGFCAFQVEVPLLQAGSTDDEFVRGNRLVNVPHSGAYPAPIRSWRTGRMDRSFGSAKWLLRKEVIQPHLPVRLPCYDLVLIASPTFDGSLHKGWATGFGCYRLS